MLPIDLKRKIECLIRQSVPCTIFLIPEYNLISFLTSLKMYVPLCLSILLYPGSESAYPKLISYIQRRLNEEMHIPVERHLLLDTEEVSVFELYSSLFLVSTFSNQLVILNKVFYPLFQTLRILLSLLGMLQNEF